MIEQWNHDSAFTVSHASDQRDDPDFKESLGAPDSSNAWRCCLFTGRTHRIWYSMLRLCWIGKKRMLLPTTFWNSNFFFERCGPDRLYTCREDSSAALLINRICYQDSRYADWELLIYYGFSSNSFPFFLLFGLGLRQFIWGPALFASHSRGNQGNFAIAYYFALIAWILYCIDGIYLFWICNDKFWSRPINFLPKKANSSTRPPLVQTCSSKCLPATSEALLFILRHCCWYCSKILFDLVFHWLLSPVKCSCLLDDMLPGRYMLIATFHCLLFSRIKIMTDIFLFQKSPMVHW